jgi:hypothetical protein
MTSRPTPAPWAFDVDGSLVDLMTGRTLRPHAVELISHLIAADVPVLVWSAGGADYARRTLAGTPFADAVVGYYDKIAGPDGRWRLDVFDPHPRPVVCVDDDTTCLPDGPRVLAVWPFISPNPHDHRLLDVLRIAQADHPCVGCCLAA